MPGGPLICPSRTSARWRARSVPPITAISDVPFSLDPIRRPAWISMSKQMAVFSVSNGLVFPPFPNCSLNGTYAPSVPQFAACSYPRYPGIRLCCAFVVRSYAKRNPFQVSLRDVSLFCSCKTFGSWVVSHRSQATRAWGDVAGCRKANIQQSITLSSQSAPLHVTMRPSVPALCLALPYPILQVFFFIASFLVVFTVAFLGLAIIVASPLLIKAATNHLMMSNRGGTEYAPLFRGIGVSELQMTCGSTLSRLSHFGQCILSSVMAVWLPTVFQAMFPRQVTSLHSSLTRDIGWILTMPLEPGTRSTHLGDSLSRLRGGEILGTPSLAV